MPQRRIILRNWQVYAAPANIGANEPVGGIKETQSDSSVEEAVTIALNKLAPREKEFVIRYFFQGETYCQIADALKISEKRIGGLHERAIRKLKKSLSEFVKTRYGIHVSSSSDCPICLSSDRPKIEKSIRNKKRSGTWKSIIRSIKRRYKIDIRTPQIVISHEKYHMEA